MQTISEITEGKSLSLPTGNGVLSGFSCEVEFPAENKYQGDEDVPLVLCRQTHSLNVAVISEADSYPQDVDAMITQLTGLAIGVRTADCVPVLLSAPDIKCIAAIHAGWRGTIGKIVERTIRQLTIMGADVKQMRASIGAAICQECYEVDASLGDRFQEAGFGRNIKWDGKPHLDLKGMNRDILLDCGVLPEHITVSDICTRHTLHDGVPVLPSYRRENGTDRRLVTFISIPRDSQVRKM